MEPKMPTPGEMARQQRERTLNDAERLKDGAEYKYDENGNGRLEFTADQVADAEMEMNLDLASRKPDKSPDEILQLEKDRALNDATLLETGAEYIIGDNGEKRLHLTGEQEDDARLDMMNAESIKSINESVLRELLDGTMSEEEYIRTSEGPWGFRLETYAYLADAAAKLPEGMLPSSELSWSLAIKKIKNKLLHAHGNGEVSDREKLMKLKEKCITLSNLSKKNIEEIDQFFEKLLNDQLDEKE